MKPPSDLGDMLVEEVMCDMAETFFGSRVEIDEMLELFEKYVEELKKKSEGVALRAGFLNTLLIDAKTTAEFYSHLKVDPQNLLNKNTYSEEVLPGKMPISITEKSEFTKLFLFAYESLQKACREYARGNNFTGYDKENEDEGEGEDEEKEPVNYALLLNMSRMINEKIKKVNERSTICTLQYTRQFKPDVIEKEHIVGTGFSDIGCDGLDRNMKFEPLNFDSYKIDKYPELPKIETVKSDITAFAKKVFSDKTIAAKKVLSDIRGKRRVRKK
jgi:hypothetical protein